MTVDVLDASTGELLPFQVGAQLAPDQVRARSQWVREVTKAALIEGVDYGKIPGTGDKPTLLKPGAEMLLFAAGLGFGMTKVEDADSRGHHGVTYTCTVRRGDFVVAECDGYAGYDESRFYVSAEDNEARERHWAEKDRRPLNPLKCVEYRAPWNTLVKMAQKRALVGATLNACAASGLFIADLDDVAGVDFPGATVGGDASDGSVTAQPRRGRGRKAAAGSHSDPPAPATPTEPAAEVPPERVAIAGTAELERRLRALGADQQAGFKSWRASRELEWPPTTPDELALMVAECGVIEARAAEDTDAYGR